MPLFLGALSLFVAPDFGLAKNEIKIVTTTKTFADLVKVVGGDLVKVDYVAPPNQNVHFVEPRPSDILRLSKADLFVHGGLDLELWRAPLAEASGKSQFFDGGPRQLDLSEGLLLLEIPEGPLSRAQGDIHVFGNPHYWTSPENAKIIVKTIADKLSELSPENKKLFEENLNRYLGELDKKILEWKEKLTPWKGKPIVVYHNSWPYLADFAGLEIAGFVEPKPGIPPTAKHIQQLLGIMKEKKIKVIIKETFFENKTPKKLSEQTGAVVINLPISVGETKEARDYISMIDSMVTQITQAFEKEMSHD